MGPVEDKESIGIMGRKIGYKQINLELKKKGGAHLMTCLGHELAMLPCLEQLQPLLHVMRHLALVLDSASPRGCQHQLWDKMIIRVISHIWPEEEKEKNTKEHMNAGKYVKVL